MLKGEDEASIQDLVDRILAAFASCVFMDTEDIVLKRESGWSYSYITSGNVTHLRQPPRNIIGSFEANIKKGRRINPDLRSSFRYNIIDPSRISPKGFERQCVLISIASKLEFTLHPHRTPSLKSIQETANFINMNITNPSLNGGINVENFEEIERLNHNFSDFLKNKYNFLKNHEGIAINLFRISKNNQTGYYHLYPSKLSRHWNNPCFLAIDLLEDAEYFWLDPSPSERKKNHVLLIKNYFHLINSFQVKNKLNTRRFFGHCKSCGLSFNILQMNQYNDHISQCQSHSTTHSVARRRARNKIVHKPFMYCKYKNKYVQRTMRFPVAKYHTTMAPLLVGALDWEATNIKVSQDENTMRAQGIPSTTKYIQKPLSFSYGFFTPYKKTLPPELSKICVKFLNDKTHRVHDLYISLLQELQKSVLACHSFYIDTLKNDFGPPSLTNMTPKEKLAYLQTNHCSFCGLSFRKRNPKTRHHNHYLDGKLACSESNKKPIILCGSTYLEHNPYHRRLSKDSNEMSKDSKSYLDLKNKSVTDGPTDRSTHRSANTYVRLSALPPTPPFGPPVDPRANQIVDNCMSNK